ncbi:hypothetical protein [Thermomicrobium sp.]
MTDLPEARRARSGWFVCPHCGRRLAYPWSPGIYIMREGFAFVTTRRRWRPAGRLQRLLTERGAYSPRAASERPKPSIEQFSEGTVVYTARGIEGRGVGTWGDTVICLCGEVCVLPWHDERAEAPPADTDRRRAG